MVKAEDRRRTGVHRTLISDGNGGKVDIVTVTAARVKVVAGAVVAVLGLLGAVFGAVRLGVVGEVDRAIRIEASREDGAIHQEIHKCAEEYIEEVQGVIQDDLDIFEKELEEQHDLGIRMETRQIAIDEKVDQNHNEIMRMLRQAAGPDGGGAG